MMTREFQVGVLTGIAALLGIYTILFLLRSVLGPWAMAKASGVDVEFARLIGMRLRRTDPRVVIGAYIRDRKRGGQLSLDLIEATYMAFRHEVDRGAHLIRIVEREALRTSDSPG